MTLSKKIVSAVGVTMASILLASCSVIMGPQFGRAPENASLKRMTSSPNYRGERFNNMVVLDQPERSKSTWNALYDWIALRSERVPQQDLPVQSLKSLRVADGNTNVTWMGHSTILIEIDGKTIMTDPVFSDHASPYSWLPPKSFYESMPIALDEIDWLDFVVISHDHYDHLDQPSIVALADKVGLFVVPLGVGSHLEFWGVESERIIELDWWQKTKVDSLTFTATPAQHFSGRTFTDGKKTLWAGWAIQGRDENIFFSGDSAYFPGFKQIGDRLGPFDLTLIECGAYNEAWSDVHMFPEQTAQAHQDLNGDVLLPIHWGRFDLALHPWAEPIERLRIAAGEKAIELTQPRIGERFALQGELPKTAWWRGNAPILRAGSQDTEPPGLKYRRIEDAKVM